LYDRLRTQIVRSTIGTVDGVDYAVGGDLAMNASDVKHLAEKLPWVVGCLLLLTFLMMTVAFRSGLCRRC
jgi:RND superfamily putative drug exporter